MKSALPLASAEKLHVSDLKELRTSLLAWFAQFQRDLPWRKNRDPYRIWISEIMLQQTRVAAVIPYYEKFLQRFPNVGALAEAPHEEVLRLWSGLGYYSRARNLQTAAQQIVARHEGEFPRTRDEILNLSGIGEYTVAAILSIAFGEKHAVLDGNVARVIARIEAIRGDLRQSKQWRELQSSAGRLLAPESPGDWNQAMMELGATVCTPVNPQCLLCPAAKFCEGRKLGIAASIPEKRKKRATVAVHLASAVLLDARSNTLLLPPPAKAIKSTADDHVPSLVAKLWHFPTVSASADPEKTIRKFLHEDFKIKITPPLQPEILKKVRHTVTYRVVSASAYLIRMMKLPQIPGAKSLPLASVDSLSISNLTRKIARNALKHLSTSAK